MHDQHSYTITTERPEITQAKVNAVNFSEVMIYKFLSFFFFFLHSLCYFKVNDHGLFGSLLQIKYRESWHTLRAQGYKLTMQDIPFQAAKSSMGIASDVNSQSLLF